MHLLHSLPLVIIPFFLHLKGTNDQDDAVTGRPLSQLKFLPIADTKKSWYYYFVSYYYF